MAQDQQKDYRGSDMENHKTDSLFSEWPTPADTIRGFGGNPEKADEKQWKMRKRSH